MKSKTIIFSVIGAYLLLAAAAIYGVMELLQFNFTIASLMVITVFWAITRTVAFYYKDRLISGLIQLSKDRKIRRLNNYRTQLKLHKLMLWLTPIYVFAFVLLDVYFPEMHIEFTTNIVVIVALYYLGVVLEVLIKKFAINKLKENLLNYN